MRILFDTNVILDFLPGNVLYKSTYHSGVDVIVTRDRTGFGKSDIPVMTPQELLALLESI